jgi:tetratricopeptide (TPR) repeat protein
LLIGVSDYPGTIQDLKFPGADARSIKDLLISSAGFAEDHVRLLTDDGVGEARATKQNVFAAIDQYLAPRVQPGHEIIIFLAGHGVVRGIGAGAKSYYLPVDIDVQTKEALESTAIDMEELSRKLSALKASQFTVFYDACREDPFPGRGLKGNTLTDVTARILTLTPTRLAESRTEPPTSVIFYACQIGERAYENAKLQHGVFTYYILRGLQELAARPDGGVDAGRLSGYLSENVRKWTREEAKIPIEQNPTMVATDVRGPVLIARILPLSANVPEAPPIAGILLNTSPEGGTISINGQLAGRGPLLKDLAPNQYTVRAELPGFQPSETSVNVIAGYRQEITINLQALAKNSNYEKGAQFERQQLWPQAIASYQQALREDSNSAPVYERLAQAYVKNGRYLEAVNLLTVAIQKFPDNALILARRSRAQSAMRSDENDLAASTGPTGAPPSASQSLAPQSDEKSGEGSDKKSKKDKKSEKDSKRNKKDSSEESRGDDIQRRSLTGSAPAESRQNPTGSSEAIHDAELAIQKDDGLSDAHLALGFALLAERKDYDRAMDAFIRASTIAPEDAEAYFGVGFVYRLKRQCEQAAPQFKKAIELRPDYYEAQRELAYCYHTMGSTDQAIRQYEVATSYRAETKDSSDYAANNLALASLYRKKGDEIGGAEGEEYRKTGKACEDDAREQEPDLKGAVKKLNAAGVLPFVKAQASPDIRKVLDGVNLLNDGKIPTNIPTDVPIPINNKIKSKIPFGIKIPIKTKADDKESKDDKAPKDDKTSKDDKAPSGATPTPTPTPKPSPTPTPKPSLKSILKGKINYVN